MKLKFVTRWILSGMFSLGVITNLQAQPSLPPDDTNAPPSGTNTVDLSGFYSNNLASVWQWLHDGCTLPDGTPADFQTIMDQQAMACSENAAGMAGQEMSALDAAWTWAINNDVPTIITNADGICIAALMEIRDGVPLYNGGLAVEAAQTIETDRVWPGGFTGFNLNGTNRTVSMWDQGSLTVMPGRTVWFGHRSVRAGQLMTDGSNRMS